MEGQVQEQESGFQLRDVWAIVQMQWRVVVGFVVGGLALAVVVSLVSTRQYQSTVVMHLSPMAGQEFKSDKVLDLDQYQRWNRHMFVETQLEILYSRTLREEVLRRYVELGYTDLTVDDAGLAALREMMEAKPRLGTELLDLAITTPDPERSALIANLIADVYEEKNLDGLRDAAKGAGIWVEEQLVEYKSRIDQATADLLAFQRANGMADAEMQITSLEAKQTRLSQAHAEVNTEVALQDTTVRTYERLLREKKYEELAKELDTSLGQSLAAEYARIATELAKVSVRWAPEHDERKKMEQQLATIEQTLKSDVERTISASRARLTLLQARKATLEEELKLGDEDLLAMQRSKADYDKLRVELDAAKDKYASLRTRRDELELQAQTQLNNVRIIDRARPPKKPVEPNVPINLLLGVVGGLVIGVGVGLLREYIDDTISSPLDVTTYLKVPFLGTIPKIAGVTDETELALHTHHHPRSSVAESIRAIRTVLELNPLGETPKRLLITSAVSAEGKTSTIVRLGVAFANLDRRVLMIDCDLRRPRLHKVFGLEKENGLSAVLHETRTLDECIQPTLVPNLFVLPSGPGGDRPNELLASSKLARLLDTLDGQYDLLLIDSPPSVLLSDAQILSRYVDGVIVIAREHTASRMLIRDAVQNLDQVGARVLGVVINAVDFGHRRTSYKYYYGYGYRYDKYYDERRGDAAAK